MDPIKSHKETSWVLINAMEVRKLIFRTLKYALIDGIFYKKSFFNLYLRFQSPLEVELSLKEVH